ncbi:MAG: hypothetical protein J0L84_03520, partial [Verrucomicrobia bacterium]|nr:hypothetical protein [Verrucomicrobiota bacterium]
MVTSRPLRFVLFGVATLVSWLAPTISGNAQTLTDHFADAVPVVGREFPHVATNSLAARPEPGEPAHLGVPALRSQWARWRPDVHGQALLRLRSTSNVPLRLAVYVGGSLSTLTPVAGVTEVTNAAVLFEVAPGQTYQVVVDPLRSAAAPFELDGGVAPLVLQGITSGMRLRTPTHLTLQAAAPPTEALTAAEFVVNGLSLGLRTVPPFSEEFAWNEAGLFRVRAIATNAAGERLESHAVDLVVRPANDDVADAHGLSALPLQGVVSGDSQWASNQAGEDPSQRLRPALWWRWSPPYSGELTVEPSAPDAAPQRLEIRMGGAGTPNRPLPVVLDPLPGDGFTQSVAAGPDGTVWWAASGKSPSGPAPISFRYALATLAFDPPPPAAAAAGEPLRIGWRPLDANVVLQDVALMSGDSTLAVVAPGTSSLEWTPPRGGAWVLHWRGTDAAGVRHESRIARVMLPPHNDRFGQAEALPSGLSSLVFTNWIALLSSEPEEPAHAGIAPSASVWWTWTPERDGFAEFRASSPEAHFVALAAYTGDALQRLESVGSNRDARRALHDRAIFRVQAGRRYHLVADAPSAQFERPLVVSITHHAVGLEWPLLGGDLALGGVNPLRLVNGDAGFEPSGVRYLLDGETIGGAAGPDPVLLWLGAPLGPHELMAVATNAQGEARSTPSYPVHVAPSNDLRQNAAVVPDGSAWRVEGDRALASWETGEADGGTEGAGSLWFRWQSPRPAMYLFRVTGDTATSVGIHQGDAAGNVWLTARLTPGGLPEPVFLDSAATAYFQVHGPWTPGHAAPFQLERVATAVNDDLENAVVVSGTSATLVGDVALATRAPEEPMSGLVRTLWWTWVAPDRGEVTFDASGGDGPVSVALFGAAPSGLPEPVGSTVVLAAPQTFRVVAGRTYFIALGSSSSSDPVPARLRV